MELENKKEDPGEETVEFMTAAEKYDNEFPIPPQEDNMRSKMKWFALGALAVALIAFSSTAKAAGAEDVILGVVAGYLIGDHIGKNKMESPGSASYIDLTLYNVTLVAPDGTLVLTPIGNNTSKNIINNRYKNSPSVIGGLGPPCTRSSMGYLPALPGQTRQKYWIPKCPNRSMLYGGLIYRTPR